MKKVLHRFGLLFAILSLIFLCACAKEDEAEVLPELPSVPSGFSLPGQLKIGGVELDDANARTLTVESRGEETSLAFTFVSGSRMSGGDEEVSGGGIPTYTAYTLQDPARLVVEFDLLGYWDYAHGFSLDVPSMLGYFQQTIFEQTRVSIYFQLKENSAIRTEEDGDTLRIYLNEIDEALDESVDEQEDDYFVVINAYDAYIEGAFSAEYAISPTLSSDLVHRVLISRAFATEAEAVAFINNGQATYPDIPKEQWQTVQLATGELPDYRVDLALIDAYSTPVVRYDNTELALPVVVPDGLYLANMPTGGYLYTREAGEGESVFQQLYVLEEDGGSRLLTPFEFISVESALFSPDGRKLAVLERGSESTHLYVFDTDTYELLNDLSEMGFGTNTNKMTFNAMGNVLYAISGTSGMQIHQFDYAIPDEMQRHSVVDNDNVDEGSLGLFDGELYFTASNNIETGPMVYSIKPEGGVPKPYLPGSSFAISDDSRYMAIVKSAEQGGGSGQSFTLIDLQSQAQTLITDEFYPYIMFFAPDGEKLYYVQSRISGGLTEDATSFEVEDGEATSEESEEESVTIEEPIDDYPFTLWEYDVNERKSETILDLKTAFVYPSNEEGILYVNIMEAGDENNAQIRSFYRLDLDELESLKAEQTGQTEGIEMGIEIEAAQE